MRSSVVARTINSNESQDRHLSVLSRCGGRVADHGGSCDRRVRNSKSSRGCSRPCGSRIVLDSFLALMKQSSTNGRQLGRLDTYSGADGAVSSINSWIF